MSQEIFKARVATKETGMRCLAEIKEIDLSKVGNRKWLMAHVLWAAKNNRTVTIRAL